ncbi:hypothetical protein PDE_02224 [Penicillium oxalicum 114-2]|uniref:Uncharacterized protein n=1 Tax=Penicillium oxalicum (strain 114-2 / CGMCC 5302) TaxID=933388 RepID=S7ZF35_PENO1|nr:hypothetical protein PDE_02224 [Penicillium oxalicum 114-2]
MATIIFGYMLVLILGVNMSQGCM